MKTAEDILLKKCSGNKVFLTSNELHTIIEAMEEYHSQFSGQSAISDEMKEIFDEIKNIRDYMEGKDAIYGLGQLDYLVKKCDDFMRSQLTT